MGMPPTMSVKKIDITTCDVDAIVNAANTSLLGGGGVDGAIHAAAGPALLAACRKLNGCATGDAKSTPGFFLPARWVIHTVGPVWHDGTHNEDVLLASCYTNSLRVADELGVRSIAFPAISCGVYRFPPDRASAIAVSTVVESTTDVKDITFACFDDAMLKRYEQALRRWNEG